MTKFTRLLCTSLALLFCSEVSLAEVKLIANSELTAKEVNASEVADVFLGKSTRLTGIKVTPIDQSAGEEARDEFYQKIANKNAAQLKAYWSGLIFTGKGMPPKSVLDNEEVVEYVAENPEAIGYVSGEAEIAGVKVLLSLP